MARVWITTSQSIKCRTSAAGFTYRGRLRQSERNYASCVASTLFLLLCVTSSVFAQGKTPQTEFDFNIPQQRADRALTEFAEQADLTMVFSDKVARAFRSNPVIGTFSLEAGIQQLLLHTDLIPVFNDGLVLKIIKAPQLSAENRQLREQNPRGLLGWLMGALRRNDTNQQVTPDETTQRANDHEQIEEILVTSLKRENQSILDAAAIVNIIDGQSIERWNHDSLDDFIQQSPGVTFVTTNNDGVGNASIQIRGVNTTFGAATVGFYIDDLPFSFINGNVLPDPTPYDLNSIEILKGPQGTLYGAGSSGGVVVIRTKDPDLEKTEAKFDINLSETHLGSENYSGSMAINIPLIESSLGFRAAVSTQRNSGWITDSALPEETELNEDEKFMARGKLLFTPNQDLTVKLSANYNSYNQGTVGAVADANFQLPAKSLEVPSFGAAGGEATYTHYGLSIQQDTPWFTLHNALSYLDFDGDSTRLFFVPLSNELGLRTVANELRLNSAGEQKVRWLAGLFYRNSTQRLFQNLALLGPFFNVPPGFNTDDKLTSEQFSLFGEATFSWFAEQLEVTAGLSYFEDDMRLETNLEPISSTTARTRVTTDLATFATSLAYYPNENLTLYARYAQGFRPGTTQAGISTLFAQTNSGDATGIVSEEKSASFEAGFKGSLLDNKLYLEIAAFLVEIEDVQQNASVSAPGSSQAVNTVLNAGDATSKGVEWTLQAEPLKDLGLSITGAYLDAATDEDFFAPVSDPDEPPLFAADTPLNLTPKWLLSGQINYSWPLLDSGLTASMAASLQYASKRTLTRFGEASLTGDDLTRLNLRFEVGRGDWALYVFANNLNNEDGILVRTLTVTENALTDRGFPPAGNYGTRPQPRTIGAGIRSIF